jgi:hypothetical protein
MENTFSNLVSFFSETSSFIKVPLLYIYNLNLLLGSSNIGPWQTKLEKDVMCQ